jgi:Tol biopolymer transport system component
MGASSTSTEAGVASPNPEQTKVARIAYVAASDQGQDIYTIFPDGATRRRVTYSGDAGSPAWAPDGTRLAYAENGDIWVTGRHGSARLTSGESVDRYPAWSPDGERLSFTRDRDNGESVLVVLDLTTRALNAITQPSELWPGVGPATWAPDGQRIAFVRWSSDGDDYANYRQLHLIDADGSDLSPLPEAGDFLWDPSWSPDGDRILYTSDYSGRGGECDAQVLSIRIDGTGSTDVFSQGCDSRAGSWSPSGARIVVDADGPVADAETGDDPRLGGVWTLRPDGTGPRLVARSGWDPVWQPVARAVHTPGGRAESTSRVSGPRLAYTASSTLGWDIYTIRPDGSGQRQLTRTGNSFSPTWSPDHSRLAFMRDRDLWVMDARGGHQRRIEANTWGAEPDWSPDGRRIAWSDYYSLVVANLRTGTVRDVPLSGRVLGGNQPAWSPNGRRLAFEARSDIYTVRLDGSGLRRITFTPGREAEPEWSPSGRRIAFSYVTGPRNGVQRPDVLSVRSDGLARQIIRETPGADYTPAWSSEGRWLVVYSEGPDPYGDNPRPGMWIVRPDGGRLQLVAEKREVLDIDW